MPVNSENLNLAKSLDLSTTNRVLVDSISASNSIDTYRLTVSRSSDLKLSLQGLKANADIQVIQDANGNGRIDDREVLTSSGLKGVGLDSINVSLAGTYFVQAYAGDKGATTGYSLNYSATALGNPDSADLTATRSYFGTGVIRSFYNSRGISIYQNPSSSVVAFGSAQGQPNSFLMYGAIADYYTNNYTKNPSATNGLNGVASGLGNPTSAIYEQADGSSVMDFEGGQLVNRGGVVTPIYSKRGGDRFDLVGQGAPNGTELQWKDDYAWFGRDSVGQATGAVRRISNGYIQEFTGSKDGNSIFLLKDSQQVIGGVEQYKDDNGKLINTPKGGPYRVQGGVLQAYRSVGGAERVDGLGFATFSTERANFKGYKVYQEFENGFIAITKDNQVLIRDRQGQPILPPSPDYAGNTLQAAKSINIGALTTYQDFVGTADTNDYYKFTILSKSSINASLSNLSADANLQLLNSAGTVIGSSNNPGSASEEIYRSLDAGTYYIRAYQASGNTNYNLNIFASQIAQTGDVISVRGSDGNLNVFAVGKDDKVWLWKQSDNNYTWWHDMGFTAQNIQVIQGGDGKLHVLGVGKDASTWLWNESDNNYTWWHNMGFGAQNVQATVGGDGKLHVLGVGKDASTWLWNESDNNYTWWHNMGFGAQNVQATVGGDGKLHVLGVGKDASTWLWNESDNNYTWWHNMGFGAQNVQATVGGDGKLHVLGVGKDASTWLWNESDNNYTWWHNMGFGAQNVQATVGGDGKLHVLGVGKDASTWLWNESDNNYTWWHNMGFGAQNVQATVGGDGKLHVLGVGKDASTWLWNESDNNYTWWHNMGFGAQNVQATVGGDGKLHVLGVGKDASTWMWNESDNNYTWWHNMGFGAQNVQATVGGDGKLHVLGVGKDASTWLWNESDNNYTWWHNMGFGARQTTVTNGSYFSDLSSLTDDEWDTYSGDNTRFDPNTWDGGLDERSKTPDSIKQIYTDLSVAIFGSRHQMNTGYMYDKSYHDGLGTWHAGFDLEAAVGTSIKTVVGGTIAWTSIDSTTGVFIGVNGDDGRQWVYGHMQSIQFAQGARIDAGQVIGVVGSQPGAKHFHLEVETGLSYGKTNGADPDQNHLRNVTVSPLQAFWQWQNKNGKTTTQQPVKNNGAASQSSDAGLKFISRWEGFRSNIYNDPLNATIGFGHLIHYGKINGTESAEFRNGITESRALELLKDDIAGAEQAVRNTVKVLLTQNQFDALVSFTFNNGSGGLAEMIGLTRLNLGDYASVSSKLKLYVHDNNGKVIDGLVNRRRDEANLFDNGVYG